MRQKIRQEADFEILRLHSEFRPEFIEGRNKKEIKMISLKFILY